MRVKRIRIKNMRSFEDQEINLPKGKVLLAGDIGSGKSTVLLTLEFALFGLQPGFISGNDLLRKGKDYAESEVELEIGDKNIIIQRSLKRKKTSVAQDKGFLEVNGQKEQLSPEELKAKILALMNYPSSLVKTKSNLLYRFTIYTPQEQMKYILLEKDEERINTLRRIFDIDKYKNIASNLELFSSKIKEEIKVLEAQSENLEEIKKEIETKKVELETEKQKSQKMEPLLDAIQDQIHQKQELAKQVSEQVKVLNFLKTENASLKAEYKSILIHLDDIKKQIEKMNENSTDVKISDKNFREDIEKVSKELDDLSTNMQQFIFQRAQNSTKEKEINKTKENIISLNICPTCKQFVSDVYKRGFAKQMESDLDKIKKEIEAINIQENTIKEDVDEVKKQLEKLREEEKQTEVLKEKIKFIEDQKRVKQKLTENFGNLVQRQEFLLEKLRKNENDLEQFKDVEKENEKIKRDIDTLREEEKRLAIEKAKIDKQTESIQIRIIELEKDILKREKIIEKSNEYKKLNEWIAEQFIPLILKIEKNVMLAVNFEFNKMFSNWFSMLTDNLNARVDENFTPIIEQGGYEISYEALSGGERTAAALAYRLSLNQIINSLMSNLATKGLLILDEPTDGFSSEQLDKMKDILDEITTDQLLIVSHESKIENFVENVIKFKKENNVSFIS